MTDSPPDMTDSPPDMTDSPPDMTDSPPDMTDRSPPDMTEVRLTAGLNWIRSRVERPRSEAIRYPLLTSLTAALCREKMRAAGTNLMDRFREGRRTATATA
jgi:hypothetical protein